MAKFFFFEASAVIRFADKKRGSTVKDVGSGLIWAKSRPDSEISGPQLTLASSQEENGFVPISSRSLRSFPPLRMGEGKTPFSAECVLKSDGYV